MAYWMDIWKFKNSNEYEYKFAGNYGAKGEKRKKKKKVTPEQIIIQNRLNKAKKIRREIKANFEENDYWTTLTYRERKDLNSVKRDVRRFLENLRKTYKKQDETLKFIGIIEIGKKGGIHIHIIINRARAVVTDILIKKYWPHGSAYLELLYERGGYNQLASYMAKVPDEEQRKKGKTASRDCIKESYTSSRNLVRPKAERKKYSHWTVRRIIKEGPKPKQGYYIDKNTIRIGFNKFTGYSYIHYTEVRL